MAGAPDSAQAFLEEAIPGLSDPLQLALARSLEGGVRFALGQGGQTALMLLEAARAMVPLDLDLARQSLVGALEAAVYIQPAMKGPVLREIAGEARAIPESPESPPSAVNLLLDGY